MNLEMGLILFCLACALAAVVFGAVTARWVLSLGTGTDRMQEIARAIQEGAQAFLNRQYTAIGLVGLILFVVLLLTLGFRTALGFFIGAVLSAAAGYIGMYISVRANVRTTEAARL